MTSQGDAEWALANMNKKLVDGKITGTCATEDGESYGIIVKNGNKEFRCWIDCDPEGNGPGFMKIEEGQTRGRPPRLRRRHDRKHQAPAWIHQR